MMLDLKETTEKFSEMAYTATLDAIEAQNMALKDSLAQSEKFYETLSKNLSTLKAFELPVNFQGPEPVKFDPLAFDASWILGLAGFHGAAELQPLGRKAEAEDFLPSLTLTKGLTSYNFSQPEDFTAKFNALTPDDFKLEPIRVKINALWGYSDLSAIFDFEPLTTLPEAKGFIPNVTLTKAGTVYTPADFPKLITEWGETLAPKIEKLQNDYAEFLGTLSAQAESFSQELSKTYRDAFGKAAKILNVYDLSSYEAASFKDFDLTAFFPYLKTSAPGTQKPVKPAKKSKKTAAAKITAAPIVEPAKPEPAKPAEKTIQAADKYAAYLAKVNRYDAKANPDYIKAIVHYCGIALSTRDGQLVACTDPAERDQVKNGFLTKKLEVSAPSKQLDAKVLKVCELMKADRFKDRVTFYYLLAKQEGKLEQLIS